MAVPEKTGRKERRRAARRAQKEQRQKQKQRRLPRLGKPLAYAAGIVLIAAAGYWAYAQWTSGAPGEYVPSMGNRHIAPSAIGLTTYNSDPPTSGPHLGALASWGVHENPIPKELQIHNLEDGGVVVQYNCPPAEEGCRKLVGELAEIVRRYNHAILAPYPGMSHKIALTAWTRIDKFDELHEKRIVRFIETYINIDHHARK